MCFLKTYSFRGCDCTHTRTLRCCKASLNGPEACKTTVDENPGYIEYWGGQFCPFCKKANAWGGTIGDVPKVDRRYEEMSDEESEDISEAAAIYYS